MTINTPLAARLKKLRAIRHAGRPPMDDAAYRALLMRTAGVESSTRITRIDQADAVIAEFRRLGVGAHPRRALDAVDRKIWSLWQQLADAGLVRDRSMRGLRHWVKRQTNVDAIEFLNRAQEDAVIESLKKWLRRSEDRGQKTEDSRHAAALPPITELSSVLSPLSSEP
ncbi:MAG: regulatory protein GemA [Zoogloeaceae bacterium]|jgi:hypothetical protein|nr:regulatory protein GemA [Zoogloeaceae bacterium]